MRRRKALAIPSRKAVAPGLLAAAAVALAGCGTLAPPAGGAGAVAVVGATPGFTARDLGGGRFAVRYIGGGTQSRAAVERAFLVQAAALALRSGRDWFAVDGRRTERTTIRMRDPDPFARPGLGLGGEGGGWRPAWRTYGSGNVAARSADPFWGEPFYNNQAPTRAVEVFQVVAEVALHSGAAPVGQPQAFDARTTAAEANASARPAS